MRSTIPGPVGLEPSLLPIRTWRELSRASRRLTGRPGCQELSSLNRPRSRRPQRHQGCPCAVRAGPVLPRARQRQSPPLPECWELLGCTAYELASKQRIGTVEDVLDPAMTGQPHPLLKVRAVVAGEEFGDGHEGCEEHLIPYVCTIVPRVDLAKGEVYVDPPKGLLELGRRRLLTQRLRSVLAPYTQALPGGGRVMPSRSQLEAAGRHDVVRLVVRAGGFLEVAQELGLRSKRRPAGYWEDEGNLERELTLFVGAHWAKFEVPGAPGESYWYNQVTHGISWEEPQLPELIPIDDEGSYLLTENEADRVVPSRRAVLSAGRYDLDQAIVAQGGYRQVAKLLGRRPAWPPSLPLGTLRALRSALREFTADMKLPRGVMPSASQLRDAGRGDIYQAVLRQGGFHAVAARLSLQTKHKAPASWQDLHAVVGELREFMGLQEGQPLPAGARLPTHAELRAAGKHNLRYALQKHGSARLAVLLGLAVDCRGRGAASLAAALGEVPAAGLAGPNPAAAAAALAGADLSAGAQHSAAAPRTRAGDVASAAVGGGVGAAASGPQTAGGGGQDAPPVAGTDPGHLNLTRQPRPQPAQQAQHTQQPGQAPAERRSPPAPAPRQVQPLPQPPARQRLQRHQNR